MYHTSPARVARTTSPAPTAIPAIAPADRLSPLPLFVEDVCEGLRGGDEAAFEVALAVIEV
jgi:hypothetical protein